MKNSLYLVPLLLTLVGCNSRNNNHTDNYQQPAYEIFSDAKEDITPIYVSPEAAAPEIARSFVRRNFTDDCKFDSDVVLENTMVDNRFKVLQQFTSNSKTYVYKIYIQYFDGDVSNISSWEFSQLVVEESSSGKQTYYKGYLDNRIKKSVGVGNTVEFAGVDFKIIDVRLGTSISFSHKGKLTRKQLAAALKEMHDTYKYDFYHIHHDNSPDEDYFYWQATGNLSAVYDFENNKIYVTLDDYINGKAAM